MDSFIYTNKEDVARIFLFYSSSTCLKFSSKVKQSYCYTQLCNYRKELTAWKMSKYGVFSSPYFPAFSLDTGKYGPEKAPYLDTFHAVLCI